jgi:hypothetical protein
MTSYVIGHVTRLAEIALGDIPDDESREAFDSTISVTVHICRNPVGSVFVTIELVNHRTSFSHILFSSNCFAYQKLSGFRPEGLRREFRKRSLGLLFGIQPTKSGLGSFLLRVQTNCERVYMPFITQTKSPFRW